MKKTTRISFRLALLISLFVVQKLQAQGVAINATGSRADTSAMLDVNSTTKGILIPRMTTAQRNAIPMPATGLMVYQTDSTTGFYYYNGSAWQAVAGGAGWSLTGNSGTNPTTNFIGTTDTTALKFRVNNTWAGAIDPIQNSTSFGLNALQSNTGNNNTAFGAKSLMANTTGSSNTAFGYQTLASATTGSGNTSVGARSLILLTTGNYNTGVGFSSLFSTVTGSNNIALGANTLQFNTGNSNTALGAFGLVNNTSGGGNTSVGHQALFSNTTGISNIAIGVGTLYSNTTGSDNIAIGNRCLINSSSSPANTAIGSSSLESNTIGQENTATGYQSLQFNTTGYSNSAVGVSSLCRNTTGTSNTAIGQKSLYTNITGINNVAIGFEADVSSGALNNSIAVGCNALVNASNKAVIGNSSVTVIGGQVGWSTLSDGRFKSQVQENIPGLDFILKLKPVSYRFDARKFERFLGRQDSIVERLANSYDLAESMVRTGFIAQEVEQAAKQIGYNFSGLHKPSTEHDNYSLAYAEFTVPLVKAVQEQQAMIQLLQKRIIDLESKNVGLITENQVLKAELTEDNKKIKSDIEALKAEMQKGKLTGK